MCAIERKLWHYVRATLNRILCSCFIQMALARDKNGFPNIWKHFSSHQTEQPWRVALQRRRRTNGKDKVSLFRLWIYWLEDSDKRVVEAYLKTSIDSIKCLAWSVAPISVQQFDAKIFNQSSSPWESFLKRQRTETPKNTNAKWKEKNSNEHEQWQT